MFAFISKLMAEKPTGKKGRERNRYDMQPRSLTGTEPGTLCIYTTCCNHLATRELHYSVFMVVVLSILLFFPHIVFPKSLFSIL